MDYINTLEQPLGILAGVELTYGYCVSFAWWGVYKFGFHSICLANNTQMANMISIQITIKNQDITHFKFFGLFPDS